jgi:7-cyano-7-deazaguanine reductase
MDVPGMQKALLKNIERSDIIDSSVIQVLDYGFKAERDIEIEIEQPEFTSRCPLSGLPDFGCITIRYTPDEQIIELKSLKYYLLQYRNVGIFYEHVVNRILEDLVSRVHPKHMEVLGNFTSRGGITTTAKVNFNSK